jgi:hypothetical protein
MAPRMITPSPKAGRGKQCAAALGLAMLALIGGAALLSVTFWLAYAVIFLGMDAISAGSSLLGGPHLDISHGWRMLLSLAFVVLLFIQTARSSAEPPTPRPVPEPAEFYRDSSWRLSRLYAELYVIRHPIDTASRITYWLGMGPRCVWYSGRAFRRFLGLLLAHPAPSNPDEPPL